jgi:hypothetical protein
MSLLNFMNTFPGVKGSTELNNFIALCEIPLVAVLVNLGLSNSRGKLLVIIGGVIFFVLVQLVHPTIPGVGVRFHFDHLAYF